MKCRSFLGTPSGVMPDGKRMRVFASWRFLFVCSFVAAAWVCQTTEAAGPGADEAPNVPLATACSQLHRSLLEVLEDARTQNMAFSPSSILRVLRLLQAGAAGQTLQQIVSFLDLEIAPLDLPNLSRTPEGRSTGIILQAADRLYVGPDFEGEPTFENYCQRIHSQFGGTTEALDLARDPVRSARIINRFVNHATFGEISQVVSPADFTSSTKMAVINALYLKASWSCAFDPYGGWVFHAMDRYGAMVEQEGCQFMYKSVPLLYSEFLAGETKAIRVPYKHPDLAMYFFMPSDLQAFESAPDFAFQVDNLVDQMKAELEQRRTQPNAHSGNVEIYIPKFVMPAEQNKLEVARVLDTVGIRQLFQDADLSRMTTHHGVGVSMFRHVTFLEVDEEGTTGAAATAACVADGRGPTIRARLRFDQPFFFQLRYQPDHERSGPGSAATNMVLFTGHLVNCLDAQPQ
ncbi:serpin (serine proteinase inhibitor) superfamily protein [Cystoisospora suis]|uniref:Serpin (Serine proteinase inhibitor) superfamily protein n=1 Tax=Cystoisospora suis TaxID=483139 RepID=A0A2C6KSI0_9APIC|nr:serpin (serine proteinase inhibitor) superfamily protein [Cystoisospora suis]